MLDGFDVAVNQPDLVGSVQGFGDVADDARRPGGFQWTVGQDGGKVTAFDQPHAHE